MKLSITLNLIAAAFAGGAMAVIIQTTSTLQPEGKLIVDTASQPIISSNENHQHNQNQYAQLAEKLSLLSASLQTLNNQQLHFQQSQEELSKDFLSLKNIFDTQNQTASTPLQATNDKPVQERIERDQPSRILSLDEQMRNHDTDPAWEAEALSTITNGFESINFEGSMLQAVECQGATCRIEVAHDSEVDAELFFEDSFKIVPWDHKARVEIVENNDDGITSIYYATRDDS